MLLEVDRHSGVPIYRQLIEQIRRQIMTGRLRAGDQLESVRELAGQLKVNPMTVSKSYSLLEIEGLVERNAGIGVFVAKVKKGQKDKIKAKLLGEIISKAAFTAIELGLPKDKAIDLFLRQYLQYDAKRRSLK